MKNNREYLETALIAGVIVLVGSVVLGQATVVALTQLAVAAALGLFALVRRLGGDKDGAGAAVVKTLIFIGLFLIGTAFDAVNKRTAMSRAEKIITACRAHKDKTGVFPESLQALVPDYLDAVPRAKYTVLWGKFHYGEGRLAWMLVPMTVMPSYDLNAGRWSFSPREAIATVLGKLEG